MGWMRTMFVVAMVAATNVDARAGAAGPGTFNSIEAYGQTSPWASTPDETQSEHLVPRSILDGHKMESSTMRCRVGSYGDLQHCVVDWESRLNAGLCEASLAAAALLRLKPTLSDGTGVEGYFANVQLVFDAGGAPPHGVFPRLILLSTFEGPPLAHPLDQRPRQRSDQCKSEA